MSRVWDVKKQSLIESLQRHHRDSPVCKVMDMIDFGDEIRAIIGFWTRTFVKLKDGTIATHGPALVGVRYLQRFITEAPHPLDIATVLYPRNIHHPNCTPAGGMCLGAPTTAL